MRPRKKLSRQWRRLRERLQKLNDALLKRPRTALQRLRLTYAARQHIEKNRVVMVKLLEKTRQGLLEKRRRTYGTPTHVDTQLSLISHVRRQMLRWPVELYTQSLRESAVQRQQTRGEHEGPLGHERGELEL